jgi:hypothetical protein
MNAVLAGWCGLGMGRLVAAVALMLTLGACAVTSPGAQAAADRPVVAADRPAVDDARFSRAAADAARAQAADAARAGRGADALMAAALAVDRWPADPRGWNDLAAAYVAVGRPEGADYARFFGARLPTLNTLHPRSAASGLRALEAPAAVTDPELRRAYADAGRLLVRFYEGRYETARAERTAEEAARVPDWEPYLAYPAAITGGVALLGTFVRFARGSGASNTTR